MKRLLQFFIYTFLFSSLNLSAQNTWIVDVGGINDVYVPSNLPAVQVGDTVIWNNIGGFHNVNGTQIAFPSNPVSFGYDMPTWSTTVGNPSGSWSFAHVFTSSGTYSYHCDPHVGMGMIGTITVSGPSSVSIDNAATLSSLNDALCDESTDGFIELILNQTNPVTFVEVELYRLNPIFGLFSLAGTSSGSNNSFQFTGMDSTDYRVDLLDTNGLLIDQIFFSINDPDPLVTQVISSINPSTNSSFDGSIDITVSGGTPNYIFSWQSSNGFTSSSEDISGLDGGSYIISVTDANGCIQSDTIALSPPPCSRGIIDSNAVSCFGQVDGEITITGAFGSQDSLLYALDTVPPFINGVPNIGFPSPYYQDTLIASSDYTFENLKYRNDPANNKVYYVFVSDPYAIDSSCAYPNNYEIITIDRQGEPYQTPTTNNVIVNKLNATIGFSNGGFSVNILDGGYPWNTSVTPFNFVGYSVTWTDLNGDTLPSTTSNVPNNTTNTINGLDTGVYFLSVVDNGLCGNNTTFSYQDTIEFNPPCQPVDSVINNICPGRNEGEIHIYSLYGFNLYSLFDSTLTLLDSGTITNPLTDTLVFDSLASSVYSVQLIDSTSGCASVLIPLQVQEPEIISVTTLNSVPNNTNIICNNDSSQIKLNVNLPPGSLVDYYYDVYNPNVVPSGVSINDTSTQFYPAQDSMEIRLYYGSNLNSCIINSNFRIYHSIIEYEFNVNSLVSIADSICDPNTNGTTGKIIINLDSITNLPVKYVIDGVNNGYIDSITSNATTIVFDNLINDIYTISMIDSLGCESFDNIEVEEINNLDTLKIEFQKETCNGYDGWVRITMDTLHPYFSEFPYDYCILDSNKNLFEVVVIDTTVTPNDTSTYAWYLTPIPNTNPVQYDTNISVKTDSSYVVTFNNLTSGQYYFAIKSDECHDTISFYLPEVTQPRITGVDITKETCCGFDGSVDAIVDIGDATALSYTISFDTTVIAIDTINGIYPYMNGLNAWPSQSFIDTFVNVQDSTHFVNLTRGYYLIHLYDPIIGCEYTYTSKIDIGIDSSLSSQLDMQLSFTNMLCYDSINATVKVLYPNVCYDYQLWLYNDTLNPNLISTDLSSSVDSFVYFNELYKGIYGVQAISHSKYKGCVVRSDTIEILEPEVISYDTPLSSAVYCTNPGKCNGQVWLPSSPIGGVLDTSSIANNAVYKYYINKINTSVNYFSGPILTDSMFVGLCPGDYEVQVTDGNNCIVRDTVTVLDSSLYIDSFHVTTISCFDSANATAQVFAHGGREPAYTYVWEDSSSVVIDSSYNSLVSNLSAGIYSVTVYDSTGCMAVDFTEILSAPEKLVLAAKREDYSTAENCLGESYDGSIGFEIRGGTQPYIFNWSFYNDPSVFGTDSANSVYCDTCTSYQWDDQQIDSVYILEGLTANSYLISITDINGCADTLWLPIDSFRVTARNQNSPLVVENIVYTDSICFNSQNGDLTIMIDSIAMWPLLYSIDDGNNYSSDSIFNNLAVGTYDIKIKDFYGCTIDSSLVINEYDSLFIHLDSIQNISCYGDTNGMISITSHGGSQPHSYLWTGPNGFTSTASSITDLYIGTYSVIISDINLCQIADSFEITEPTPLQLNIISTSVQNVSCNGKDDGRAEVEVLSNSGTSPYEFLWSNGVANALNSSLSAGISTCTVTDFNGCQEVISVTIDEPNELVLNILNIEDNLCTGDQNGEIFVSGSGGTEPYQYLINNVPQNDPLFENLFSGSYTLSFIDANDCLSSETVEEIKEPGQINLPISVFRTTCNASNDGIINVIFNNGIAPYNYNLYQNGTQISSGNVFNPGDTLFLTHLSPANYYVSIEDYNGCTSSSDEVEVIEPALIVADFSLSSDLITKGSIIDITNLSTPSSGDWQANIFEWNILDGNGAFESGYDFTSANPQISYSNQGVYTITLTANNGDLDASCESVFSKVVEVQGYDVVNLFSPNDDQINDLFHFQDQLLDELYVEIYNRWGKRVYHWQDPQGFWDGKGYNSELLPEGVYFFIMEAVGKDGSEYTEKGSVTLVR